MAVYLTMVVQIDALAGDGKDKRVQDSSRGPWTSTVDWYKAPPNDFGNRGSGIAIPTELIKGVYPHLFDNATALLGDADIVPLTQEQAHRLSFVGDPDLVLQSLIKQRMERLRFSVNHPVEATKFRERDLKQTPATHQAAMDQLKSDIKSLRELEHRLKPYLIKAVTLGGTTSFSARLVSDDLLIVHLALGQHAVPMKRVPVVVFLPSRPKRVYNDVEMIQ
jgi:hypothetical protein